MKLSKLFYILFCLCFINIVKSQSYIVAPQIINPMGSIKEIKAGVNGDYFGTLDEGLQIDIYNNRADLVLKWTDPDPNIEINPKNKTKEFLKKIFSFEIFPISKKFIAITSRGQVYTIVDFNGKTIKKGEFQNYTISRVIVSPNETRFLFLPYSENYVILTDNNFSIIKKIPISNVHNAAFSPDGKWMIFGEDEIRSKNDWQANMRLFTSNGEYVKDIENDRPGRLIDTPEGKKEFVPSPAYSMVFLTNDKVAYLHGTRWTINTIRIASLEANTIFEFPIKKATAYSNLSLSSDGEQLVVLSEGTVEYYSPDGTKIKSVTLQDVKGQAPNYFYHYNPTFLASSGYTAMQVGTSSYYEDKVIEKLRIAVSNKEGEMQYINGFKVQNDLSDIRINHDASEIAIQRYSGNRTSILIDTKQGSIEEIEGTVRYDYQGKRTIARWLMEGTGSKKRKTNIMEFVIGDKRFSVLGGGYLLPNHYVAQDSDNYSMESHWILYDDKGEAVKRIMQDWSFQHGHDVTPDLSKVLYKAELRQMSDNKKLAFFFDGHLTGIGRFNPSCTKVMTGLEMGEVIIWDMNVKPSAHYKGHVKMVTGMGMSADDKIMVSVAPDNLIIIRNLVTGTVANMYLLYGNEYVVYTNKGGYDFSGNNNQIVKLFSNGEDVTEKYPNAHIKGLINAVIKGMH